MDGRGVGRPEVPPVAAALDFGEVSVRRVRDGVAAGGGASGSGGTRAIGASADAGADGLAVTATPVSAGGGAAAGDECAGVGADGGGLAGMTVLGALRGSGCLGGGGSAMTGFRGNGGTA